MPTLPLPRPTIYVEPAGGDTWFVRIRPAVDEVPSLQRFFHESDARGYAARLSAEHGWKVEAERGAR